MDEENRKRKKDGKEQGERNSFPAATGGEILAELSMKSPTTLIIMDGFGIGQPSAGNAIANTPMPHLGRILSDYPGCRLSAAGSDVGLPEGQVGNSEASYSNIGAGRVVVQNLLRINQEIQTGNFFENSAYLSAMENCREWGGALHLMGLLSDGGIHSHINHLFALLEMAQDQGVQNVYIHCFLDGRDVPPTSGKDFIQQLQAKCRQLGTGQIVTVMGRYYAMDRDKRWDRIQKAYDAITSGEGRWEEDAVAAVQNCYNAGVTDEWIEPMVCMKNARIRDNDSIIFYNFRPDRTQELLRCLADEDFKEVERKNGFIPVDIICTTEYDPNIPNVTVAYPRETLENVFGEYISKLGFTQIRIAESEKYSHITYFFDGGSRAVFSGEDQRFIDSPKVEAYDMRPEMSAYEVTVEAIKCIESGKYDVVILNFANCDMVGHTGVYTATCKAVATIDECVSRVVEATSKMGGVSLITADHGNAECMFQEDGTPNPAHTANPVPFYIVGANVNLRDGRLADIAPTMLDLMGLEKPAEMDGETLII